MIVPEEDDDEEEENHFLPGVIIPEEDDDEEEEDHFIPGLIIPGSGEAAGDLNTGEEFCVSPCGDEYSFLATYQTGLALNEQKLCHNNCKILVKCCSSLAPISITDFILKVPNPIYSSTLPFINLKLTLFFYFVRE